MTCDLEPATPGRVFRVGKTPNPWAYPDWSQAGEDGTFGNRWDDPKSSYRVLYACTQRLGALIETLARFRPDPEVVAGLAAIDGEDDQRVLPPGHVATSWFTTRVMGEATLTGSSPTSPTADHSRTCEVLSPPGSSTPGSTTSTAQPSAPQPRGASRRRSPGTHTNATPLASRSCVILCHEVR